MSTAENIFQGILERPYDDERRLFYADAIDDRERAEFIANQISGNLGIRTRELLQKNRTRWLGRLEELVTKAVFRRGFAESVEVEADTFMDHAFEVIHLAPVLDLKVTGVEHIMGLMMQDDVIQYMRGFDLSGNNLDDADIRKMVSASLTAVQCLDLSNNPIGIAALETLATASTLPNLLWVGFHDTNVEPDAVEALAVRMGKGPQRWLRRTPLPLEPHHCPPTKLNLQPRRI